MDTNLTEKTCVPCRGSIPPLPADEVLKLLAKAAGWQAVEDHSKIQAHFKFNNFRAAMDFVSQVGELAEAEFHHPDSIDFGWGFATIMLQTKKIKGLHENDFILAAKINEIAARWNSGV